MEKDGIIEETIWDETGWFKDSKGNWKTELSDEAFELKKMEEGTFRLDEVVHHPDLFRLFPEIKDVPIDFVRVDDKSYASYKPFKGEKGTITVNLNREDEKNVFTSVLHEIQHVVQFLGMTDEAQLDTYLEEAKTLYGDRQSEQEAYEAGARHAMFQFHMEPRAVRNRSIERERALEDKGDMTLLNEFREQRHQMLLKRVKRGE
jgi:hypothetical protein